MERLTSEQSQFNVKFRRLTDRLELTTVFADRFNINVAVCYMRLTGISDIRKHFGNEMMNKVLRIIDTRLYCNLREVDTIQQISDCDFIVCLTSVTEKETEAIILRIKEAVSKEINIHDFQVSLSTYIGIAMYPSITKNREKLIHHAKVAMHHAKEKGENSVVVYENPSLQSQEMILKTDLKYAIKKGELEVVYQPQLCVKRSQIVGFEALIRWHHSKYGLISPGDFITYAESTGYINKMTKWMMKQVCESIVKFASMESQQLSFSVNISFNQLLKENFMDELLEIINAHDIPPEQICFEITENIKLYSLEEVAEKIHYLKRAGIKLAIDDFGEGYFSFSDLAKIEADAVKLSKSFIDQYEKENMKVILVSMVKMIHKLGMEVVVEGVEKKEQLQLLKEIKANLIQGYYISKPMSFAITKETMLEKMEKMQEKGKLSS
ncbi:putative bifunctional diguanylate cyclase/phosphodiesterase [Lottiidibacillus patelloidae]|nr:bifunctional diguanylate cyclase/phosphodiesterase [Lottiidibacillus patelloidae]